MRNDKGSVDFVQLVVGLLIIAIAAIGATKTFVHGWNTQDWQIRQKKALSIARSEVEYLQARINSDFDPNDRDFMNGNRARPSEKLLDERDPETALDDIYCDVSYSALSPVDDPATGNGVDFYQFTVTVSWLEPWEITTRTVKFKAVML